MSSLPRAVASLARRFTSLIRACGVSRHRSAPEDPVADYETSLAETWDWDFPGLVALRHFWWIASY